MVRCRRSSRGSGRAWKSPIATIVSVAFVTGAATGCGAVNLVTEVAAVEPNTGPTSGGTVVRITGTNFASGSTVTFGGATATSVIVSSSSAITATTPAHGAGLVDVVVRKADGSSVTLGTGFLYTSPAAGPSLTSVTPNSGPLNGGTVVTIAGAN